MGCSPSSQGNAVVINIVSTASKFTIEESPLSVHHFALIFYYPMFLFSVVSSNRDLNDPVH
jgi:hypothetical protein